MKKALFAVLIVFVATTVWAGSEIDPSKMSRAAREKTYEVLGTPEVTFDLNGEFSAAGYYWDNKNLDPDDTVTYSFYKGYLSLYPKLTVGNTSMIVKIDMRDEIWGNSAYGTDSPDAWPYLYSTENNDNISIERAYLSHKFGENTTLDVGLMSGQWWATKFGDYTQPRYRVKITQKTPVGVIGALVEKDSEQGNSGTEDSEKDDYDSYALFGVTKLGSLYVKPLFFYVDRSSMVDDDGSEGLKRLYISVGIDGPLGPIDLESEWTYQDTKYEDLSPVAEDATDLGAYVNLSKTMDFGKAGIVLMYASWDDEGGAYGAGCGLDSRQDFKANLILGDEIAFGATSVTLGTTTYNLATAEDLLGMTMIKPYVQGVKLAENITCDASFGYIMSNQDDFDLTALGAGVIPNKFKDATAWELDLGLNVKINPNLYYLVDAGYADISYDSDYYDDPDSVMLLKHEILFTF
jgi:hypothetical protein